VKVIVFILHTYKRGPRNNTARKTLVVQTLDNSGGKQLLSAEIVEDQFVVMAE